jgi:glycosyltransferase involved in cell wall biosynthesis
VAAPWRAGEPLRIGSLGRLHRVKGYDVLVEAMAQLLRDGFRPAAPIELTIAGEGAERAALERLITTHGLNDIIRLPGFSADPRAFLAGLHVYVQPSRSEGFCIAMHEAMQAGLPVIASAAGEMPNSVVSGATGAIVRPANPDQLAAALRQLLSDPERLRLMGSAARARVLERYSQQNFAATGKAIIEQIAN